MKSTVKSVLSVLLFFALAVTASALKADLTLESVSMELVCQCGCGLVLNNCNHIDCGVAIPMRQTVTEKLARGESQEQILTFFVSQYGEAVLAAPTRKGFNLLAWVLPFVAIVVGGGGIVLVIVAWVKKRRENIPLRKAEESQGGGPDVKTGDREAAARHESIFQRELKNFK